MTLDHEGLYADSPSSVSLWSGRRIDPLNPRVEDIHLDDIAHALARTCRYNGHVAHHLSVARHSIWVSEALEQTPFALWGLLHDATEAYLGDMVKPVKHDPTMTAFVAAEIALESCIASRFDLPYPMPEVVHEADRHVTVNLEIGERRRWRWKSTYAEDESAFMRRYMQLGGPRLDYLAKVVDMSEWRTR